MNLSVFSKFLSISILFTLTTFQRAPAAPKAFNPQTKVEAYISETLGADKPEQYILNRKLERKLTNGLALINQQAFDSEGRLTPEGEKAVRRKFSKNSAKNLKSLISAIGLPAYSNSMQVGESGSGKTFTLEQFVAILAYGVVPDFLDTFLQPGREHSSPILQAIRDNYLGNSQIINIDDNLLAQDNTRNGKAFAKSDARLKSLLIEIFRTAHEDFLDSGLRTVFVLEESGEKERSVQKTLKSLLDETGFKTPSSDPIERGSETGFSVIGVTTMDEYRRMISDDPAIERRYVLVQNQEPTEAEALDILLKKQEDWLERFHLFIDKDVLEYIISQRNFFNNPPLAMPHSVIRATELFLLWASNPENKPLGQDTLSVEDAYRFIVDYNHLPKEVWLPKEGKAPLWNLAEKVQTHMIGHTRTIQQMARRIKTGRHTGFSEFQVYILMGPSGSGKDTLVEGINLEMFNHRGTHLKFDVGQNQPRGLVPILDGGALGTPNENVLPKLITAFSEGPPNGAIMLNEAKGLHSAEFDRLKVLIETGRIQPKGKDSRSRPLGVNILVIAGQWGEELTEGKTEAEIREIVANLTEDQMKEILMKGDDEGRRGAVPYAVIQRAIRSGGIFYLPPSPAYTYPDILRLNAKKVIELFRVKSQIDLTIENSMYQYIADLTVVNNRDPRGLAGILSDLVDTAFSEATDLGLKARNANISVSFDSSQQKVIVQQIVDSQAVETHKFAPQNLLRFRAQTVIPPGLACSVLFR